VRQWTEQDVWKGHQQPVLKRLQLRQTMQALLGRARDFLPFLHSDPRRSDRGPDHGLTVGKEVPKQYQKPRLRQLSPEHARLILFGHATVGDPAAKELMELIFSEERLGSSGS
jgi:hypothetical protein